MVDLTPEAFRTLGYQAIDLLADHMTTLPDTPCRQPVPDDIRAALLEQPLPLEPQTSTDILERFTHLVLPYPMGNAHQRFFAWVNSPPAPLAILAELLASGMNPSVAGGDHAATYVEHTVLRWLKQLLSYPIDSGGLFTSGGSVANLIGLATMRYAKATTNTRTEGLWSEAAPMVVYTSAQGHSCIEKAVELLGIGHAYLYKIPVDAEYRLDVEKLRTQIDADRAQGLRPVCVAASAGTVNTGAIDPLNDIADLCAEEDLWFHVDGAYGGVGILAEQTDDLYKGMERADSLAIDPHKWMYVPIECGCVFVRDVQMMRDAFSLIPPYLRDDTEMPWFAEFGIQQTRSFRALKVWMLLQQLGEQGYRNLISRDISLAQYLQRRIRSIPDFELVAVGPLSITCFRYAPPNCRNLDTLNRRLLEIVQQEGHTFFTSTELHGKLVLRVCIVNFRTTQADLDFLLEYLATVGAQVQEDVL